MLWHKKVEPTHGTPPAAGIASFRSATTKDNIPSKAKEMCIRDRVKNPKFEEAILNKIGSRIDTEEIEKEIEGLEKQHRQLTGAKVRLGQQMRCV